MENSVFLLLEQIHNGVRLVVHNRSAYFLRSLFKRSRNVKFKTTFFNLLNAFCSGLCQLFTVRLSNGTPRDLLSKVFVVRTMISKDLCGPSHGLFEIHLLRSQMTDRPTSVSYTYRCVRSSEEIRKRKEVFSERNRAFSRRACHLAMPNK